MRDKTFFTPREARERGLAFEDPEPVACRWCGKPLTPLGAELMGQVRWIASEPCGCEGERAERERAERAGLATLFGTLFSETESRLPELDWAHVA